MDVREFVFDVLESEEPDRSWAKIVRGFIVAAISVNVLAVIFGTTSAGREWQSVLAWIQHISVAIFTLEYAARIWSVGERIDRPFVGRIRFASKPMMLIDFAALVPAFLPIYLDLRFIRAFRLVRLLKLTRHSESLEIIADVLYKKRRALLSAGFLAVLLLVVSSSLMYYAEHSAQPEAFSSIPATIWWGVAALTSVGYGDVVPITALGRILGALVAFSGIALFGLPAGILASGFTEEVEERLD